MSIELITWLKDGAYRLKVLQVLNKDSCLPSELAKKLDLNRSSISRILKQMKEQKLIESTSAGSRTITYSISKLGKDLIEKIK